MVRQEMKDHDMAKHHIILIELLALSLLVAFEA